jgi:hypothetical protein
MKQMAFISLLFAVFVATASAQNIGTFGSGDAGIKTGGCVPATTVPAQAAAAGYNVLTFNSSTFSPAMVDTTLTNPAGKQWYFWNYFPGSFLPPSVAGTTFNPDCSMTINSLGGGSFQTGILSTAAQTNNQTSFVGTAFGGGAYFEATVSFDPATVVMGGTVPAFYAMAIEHLAYNSGTLGQFWTGQAALYDHFVEADIFEFNLFFGVPNENWYTSTMHDWYGIYNVTCGTYCGVQQSKTIQPQTSPTFSWKNAFHKVGLLWIPATGSTMGSVQQYLDDVPQGSPVTWSQFTSQSPPPANPGDAFGIFDLQHVALVIQTGTNMPVTIQSVRVWQASTVNNLTPPSNDAWNPLASISNVALSNSNLTATSLGAAASPIAISSRTHSTGKYYVEFVAGTVAVNENAVGVTNGIGFGAYLGIDANSIGYFSAGEVCSPLDLNCNTTLGAWGTGSRIGTAIDLNAHKIWYTLDGSTWNVGAGGTQNPATGAGGFDISMIVGQIMFADQVDGGPMTVNFGPSFTFPVPTGFGAW